MAAAAGERCTAAAAGERCVAVAAGDVAIKVCRAAAAAASRSTCCRSSGVSVTHTCTLTPSGIRRMPVTTAPLKRALTAPLSMHKARINVHLHA